MTLAHRFGIVTDSDYRWAFAMLAPLNIVLFCANLTTLGEIFFPAWFFA